MFVNKINLNEFKYILENYYKASVVLTLNSNKNVLCVKMTKAQLEPSALFVLTDFSCKPMNNYAVENFKNFKNVYKIYMSRTFGEKYNIKHQEYLERKNNNNNKNK